MTTRERLIMDTLAHHVASLPASVDRCSALWMDLVGGKLEIVQACAQQGRCVLILGTRPKPSRPLPARAKNVLERTLLGERRKVVACDINVSVSLLALMLKGSLASLGLSCKPALVPAALVMLVHGARGTLAPSGTFIGDLSRADRRLTVITQIFDDSVLRGLSPSQRAVMSLVANGCSCTDIAARRNRSCRTVINQVAAANRRLGVSSRFDLLQHFARSRPSWTVSRGTSVARCERLCAKDR
jgi:DNA-binding CsgD family transcriptional regulator